MRVIIELIRSFIYQRLYLGSPAPYDLTGDPDWDEAGPLLKKYDLKLDSRTGVKVYQGVREVSVTGVDTYDDSEPLESVDNSVDDAGGVRVSGPDPGIDENNLEPDAEDDYPVTNNPFNFFEGMEEFSI